jgi:hypothetical protein
MYAYTAWGAHCALHTWHEARLPDQRPLTTEGWAAQLIPCHQLQCPAQHDWPHLKQLSDAVRIEASECTTYSLSPDAQHSQQNDNTLSHNAPPGRLIDLSTSYGVTCCDVRQLYTACVEAICLLLAHAPVTPIACITLPSNSWQRGME